jgi:hypothetical protein
MTGRHCLFTIFATVSVLTAVPSAIYAHSVGLDRCADDAEPDSCAHNTGLDGCTATAH